MRTKSLKWPLFMSMAMLLALPVLFEGQTTEDQQRQQMGMESHVGTLTGRAKDGQKAYERYCIGCHGALGDGAGENAQWMEPRPRNFTRATFRCRSTPTGTLPTDEDLYDTIGRGLLNSNMPQWRPLSKQERADLVAYVKHFSTRYASEKPGAPIEIPAQPEVTAERIKAGQASFQKLECWKCHGVEGRGNGPSDRDLYKIFMTGLDGSPMPSYADTVKPDEAWNLVFYLRTLQPMRSKAKTIAKQLGLKPVNPDAAAGQD